MSSNGEVRFIGEVTRVEGDLSTIVVKPEYCPGLLRVEEHQRLMVLYWFHLRDDEEHRNTLQVVPRRHGETELTGVFTTRSPSRPNPIGVTAVDLIKVERCTLTVRGLDALEGSPVLDIKSYSHRGDA